MSTLRQNLRSLAIATAIGVTAGYPGLLLAADTEIYLGSDALRPGARPNVLFIFDTSASMSRSDPPLFPTPRIERMKEAIDLVLDSVNNINAGLMRFTEPGGPVLFPVIDLESPAEDEPAVNVRISNSADDAEELGGVMRLDSPVLELVETPVSGPESYLSMLPVTSSSDDAEEPSDLPGAVFLDSDTMEATSTGTRNRVNGMIYRDLGIPAASKVSAAFVEFHSRSDRAGPVTLTFIGELDNTPATFSAAAGPRARAPYTTATVAWTPPVLISGEFQRTPDLSAIAQEIIDGAGWSPTSDMSLVFSGTPAATDEDRRDFSTFETSPSPTYASRLSMTYGAGPGGTQKVGLRFPDVRVPQGMRIINAVIEFVPVAQSSGPKTVNVSGELAVDSAPFTTAANNITSRSKTAAVPWPIAAWPNVDETQQTPNLRAIVEQIVADSSWCGGNAMTFFIEDSSGSDARKAFSWDGDPQKAPILRIDFDETSPVSAGQGCTVVEIQRQVSASTDDAYQYNPTGALSLTDASVYMFPPYTVGWRFNDITLARGATILDASLHLTSAFSIAFATSATIRGQQSADAGTFTSSIDDITTRPSTSATASWSAVPGMTSGVEYESPNLATVVGEILTHPGWLPGNDLALTMTTSTGFRAFHSYESDRALAGRLYIKAKVYVGDGAMPAVTVRQRLKDLVAELPTVNNTPIVDTLYEAALYFHGDEVDYGLNRGTRPDSVKQRNRISHERSYINGRVEPADTICSPSNLNAVGCAGQNIVDDGGAATYVSPITEACQANFIVLLTDGIANLNDSASKIRTMTGDTSCDTTLADGVTPVSTEESCGLELASFLAFDDPDDDDDIVVNTYTIGFNISSDWLEEVSTVGAGDYFEANSASGLASTLRDIISAILSRTTSFATPSLSVNAFNRLFHRNEVYFSLFAPDDRVRWEGNVKKYQLCQSAADGCEVGEVLDYREPPPGDLTDRGKRAGLPAIGASQRIVSTARSDWLPSAAGPDGATVLVGGSGRVLNEDVGYAARRMFTYNPGTTPPALPATLSVGSVHEITATNITDVALLGGSTDATSPDFMTDAERLELIDWIRGRDVDDEDSDGDVTESRYMTGDPLHSSPVAITFGCRSYDATTTGPSCTLAAPEPVIKIFVGTNDGSVRMLNAYTGKEEWAFVPPSLMDNQRILRDNPRAEHIYGMDGTPTLWVNDEDEDGVIEPAAGDFVRMFIGMRRGGAEILALDVTPSAVMTDPVSDTIVPKLMWIAAGNPNGLISGPLEYGRLGDTWSRPRITTVRIGVPDTTSGFISVAKPVLVFAGGYDDGTQDGPSGIAPSGVGNAIYIADPVTGDRLGVVTSLTHLAAHSSGGEIEGIAGMVYPMPSDVALLDSDGDGATDRIYVGDTGGKLWRVDVDADIDGGGLQMIVGQLAALSTLPPGKKNSRKFFYPPDVVQVRDRLSFSASGNYDLVTSVTGNRSHPLDLDVQNRFYAIYDETTGRLIDGTSPSTADGVADDYPVARDGGGTLTRGVPVSGPVDDEATPGALTDAGDLLRINDRLEFDPTTTVGAANLADLAARSGYYLDFGAPRVPGDDPPSDSGEKGLASPIVLAGKVFFTTYLPIAVFPGSACSLSEGGGRLYGLDVLTGAPAYNYDESSDPTVLTADDRVYTLGGGIPSAAVPIFQPEAITLLIGGGGGATTINPGVTLPRERTYWWQ